MYTKANIRDEQKGAEGSHLLLSFNIYLPKFGGRSLFHKKKNRTLSFAIFFSSIDTLSPTWLAVNFNCPDVLVKQHSSAAAQMEMD